MKNKKDPRITIVYPPK